MLKAPSTFLVGYNLRHDMDVTSLARDANPISIILGGVFRGPHGIGNVMDESVRITVAASLQVAIS